MHGVPASLGPVTSSVTFLPYLQLFPYHLSDYICRVLRYTPFKYYSDIMLSVLKEEKSYDRIPNFTVSSKKGHSCMRA